MGKWLQALGLAQDAGTVLEAEPAGDGTSPLGEYGADVSPPSRSVVLTTERAATLPAVFRAIQIIAGMGSQLELYSVRGGQQVTPRPDLLTQPDPWRELDAFLERGLVNLSTRGNAFLLKTRAATTGTVVALEQADPRNVHIGRTRRGVKTYDVYYRGEWRHGLTDYDVEHVWGLQLPGHDHGLSPIGACRVALEGALAVREYADNWFAEDNAHSDVVLTTDQQLTPAEGKQYKRAWLHTDDDDPDHGRRGPRRIRVLGRGLTADTMTLNPAEAQWLEAQNFGILDVARMFGLPAEYLHAKVEGSSLTYSSLPMLNGQFLGTTLFPVYLRPLAGALTRCLPRGQRARFDAAALLQPDAKTRAEIDRTYLDLGVISRQEVRDREGWAGPPPAAADVVKSAPAAPAPAREDAPA